jgi:hypothetical protein
LYVGKTTEIKFGETGEKKGAAMQIGPLNLSVAVERSQSRLGLCFQHDEKFPAFTMLEYPQFLTPKNNERPFYWVT